jgi:sRNA-binding carbon storage regulator CsrA
MTTVELTRGEWLKITLPDGRAVRVQNAREGSDGPESVRLGIEADRDVPDHRREIHEQRRRERLDRGRAGLPPLPPRFRLRGGLD